MRRDSYKENLDYLIKFNDKNGITAREKYEVLKQFNQEQLICAVLDLGDTLAEISKSLGKMQDEISLIRRQMRK